MLQSARRASLPFLRQNLTASTPLTALLRQLLLQKPTIRALPKNVLWPRAKAQCAKQGPDEGGDETLQRNVASPHAPLVDGKHAVTTCCDSGPSGQMEAPRVQRSDEATDLCCGLRRYKKWTVVKTTRLDLRWRETYNWIGGQ